MIREGRRLKAGAVILGERLRELREVARCGGVRHVAAAVVAALLGRAGEIVTVSNLASGFALVAACLGASESRNLLAATRGRLLDSHRVTALWRASPSRPRHKVTPESRAATVYSGAMRARLPFERFANLDYEAYRRMAGDGTLSRHERSGFPDALREDAEGAIFADIESKLPALGSREGISVVDIGCGANPLTDLIIERCRARGHTLTLVDSPEVLAHHRGVPGLHLVPGRFPDTSSLMLDAIGSCDVVLGYSVLQVAFLDGSVHGFADAALTLLAPGGRLLLGDLPNASMRRRFLHSDAGHSFHRTYTGRDDDPTVRWPLLPSGEIDDGVLSGLVARARDGGFHAWLVPQGAELPMANRREDLLCERP